MLGELQAQESTIEKEFQETGGPLALIANKQQASQKMLMSPEEAEDDYMEADDEEEFQNAQQTI